MVDFLPTEAFLRAKFRQAGAKWENLIDAMI